jgi:hypothetical protein
VNGTVIDDDVSRPLVSLIDQKMRLTKGPATPSSITIPFTAGKPRNLQHYNLLCILVYCVNCTGR